MIRPLRIIKKHLCTNKVVNYSCFKIGLPINLVNYSYIYLTKVVHNLFTEFCCSVIVSLMCSLCW